MKFCVMAVCDSASELYARPMFVPARGAGVRGFTDEVNRKAADVAENPLNAHPEHFSLYVLGEFDDATGVITCPEEPEFVVKATDVLKDFPVALRAVN